MSKASKIIGDFKELKHSKRFLNILEAANPDVVIRTITHSEPVLVFWISPTGAVIDAKEAHHKNPPQGDRSVLSDKIHKGYLRGRAAFIGDNLYIVIYGEETGLISKRQLSLLRRAYPRLLSFLKEEKGVSQDKVDGALFIDEQGEDIIL